MKGYYRAGKTLLEAVVIISMMSLIVGLAATSLATLFRLRQQMSRDSEQAAALTRLGARLRQDVHEAVAADLNDGCLLALDDGRAIRYSFVAPSMIREVKRDETVVHRDRFLLPRSASAEFSRDGDRPGALVRLSIRPTEVRTRKTEMPRTTTIEAVVGLNRTIDDRAIAGTEERP